MTSPAAILNVNKFHYLRGGSERYYFDLFEILSAHGHRVVSFSMEHPSNRPSPQARFFLPNVSWNGASGRPSLARATAVLHSRDAERRIDALLDAEPIEIAHLHNVAHQLSPSIFGPLRRRRIPVVQTLHDYKLICPNYRLFTEGARCERCRGGHYWNAALHRCHGGSAAGSVLLAVEAALHRAIRSYERGVDLFLAPSRFLMEKVIAFGVPAERVRHVPYPVASDEPVDEAAAEPSRVPAKPLLLYAGRLAPEKGLRTLLEAAARAPRIAIQIAGEGPLRGEVAARAASLPSVTLRGHLAPPELRALERAALAVVVPSEWYENLPYAILEAFAAGKPAIASRIGGIPELVRDGQTGLLFPPADAGALAERFQRAAADPRALAAMGRRARDLVRADHDPAAHYGALAAVYDEARRLAAAGRPWRWRRPT
jgi:glycosyltransferase involved in cell wall biosynthesis